MIILIKSEAFLIYLSLKVGFLLLSNGIEFMVLYSFKGFESTYAYVEGEVASDPRKKTTESDFKKTHLFKINREITEKRS